MKLKLFGNELELTRTHVKLAPVYSGTGRGWWPMIREPYTGAWQRNDEKSIETVASHFAVYACVNLISQDIGKMAFLLKQKQPKKGGIWGPAFVPSVQRLLHRPNSFQNHIQFKETWIISKLLHGNTYVLKRRDNRGFVTSLYILDPSRVTPLVSDSGDVFYQIKVDKLSQIDAKADGSDLVVPASEIIHDRMSTLYHPLVGISPLSAVGLSAVQGLAIQNNARDFFQNSSKPGGILTAPGNISDENAARLKEYFESNFTGANAGNIAVVGDGLEFKAFTVSAQDSQLIEQLKWSAETICAAFHVPSYMVLGTAPTYNNVEALGQQYYAQCLQALIESMEVLLDDGLEFDPMRDDRYGVELDLSMLLRMDTASRYKAHGDAIGSGWKKPNEVRFDEDMEPVEGGDTPYMQVQNYSLAALAARDLREASSTTLSPDDRVNEDVNDGQDVLGDDEDADAAAAKDAADQAEAEKMMQEALGDMRKSFDLEIKNV